MPGQIKVGGTWKVVTPWIKVSGTWKKAKEGWTKVAGTWKRWWVAETPFSYTGSLQTYVVPTGTTSITVDMAGGAGGGSSNYSRGVGGRGGHRVQATLPVTPGQTLYIAVAGGGIGQFDCYPPSSDTYGFRAGGWPGGGNNGSTTWYYQGCMSVGGSGGGYSGIFTSNTLSQANALIIAGGGGGKGVAYGSDVLNGGHATTSAGGAAGGSGAQAGSALQGGSGRSNAYAPQDYPGGGGGGGYFGGGGGAGTGSGAGGDGSSWTHASATSITHTNNYRAGDGYVIIS